MKGSGAASKSLFSVSILLTSINKRGAAEIERNLLRDAARFFPGEEKKKKRGLGEPPLCCFGMQIEGEVRHFFFPRIKKKKIPPPKKITGLHKMNTKIG